MTKESCEKMKNTYVYLVWNKMEDGQRFLLPKMDIIKNGDDYEIEIVKELI